MNLYLHRRPHLNRGVNRLAMPQPQAQSSTS